MLKKILNLFRGKNYTPLSAEHFKCSHKFLIVGKTYAPRSHVTPDVVDQKTFERLSFGLTTYFFECTSCGETKREEMLGSDTTELEELIEKVDKLGPQYIQIGENTYGVGQVTGPKQSADKLPLR